MKFPSKTNLLLFSFIILGAFLRFYNIGFQHTVVDEDFTLNFARPALGWVELFIQTMTVDFTPPLYYLAAHASMLVFGATATAIRIPSAIFGVLLIPAMYLIGKEYRDETLGLLLAGLSTIFYNFVYYAKYGRAYSMALLFISLAFYYFIRLQKGDKHAQWGFAAFAILSMWTHLYTAIPIGIMILWLLWQRKATWGIMAFIVGCLPLFTYVNILLTTRTGAMGGDFGASPLTVLTWTPLDIFAYSVVIILPVVVWSLWKHRNDGVMQAITAIALGTWLSMALLALKTPIVLHYALFVVPILLLAFVVPFYEAKRGYFNYGLLAMVIIILEVVQIVALVSVQRIQ